MEKKNRLFKQVLKSLLLLLLWGGAITAVAAQQSISGKVTDDAGTGLPGVTIVVKGTSEGTITDFDGVYKLNADPQTDILVYSFVGMTTQEIALAGRRELDVTLKEDVTSLEEVVVVGYGTAKKTSLTAAVSAVKSEDLENISVANASNALVGRVPGLITRQTSGAVGEDQTRINIRGISTIGNSSPLIIVDGIIRGGLNEIDPNNVESYSVLKDAAAVAPYGMSGANGVILITTKSGASGKPKFRLNTSLGFQNPTLTQDYANSFEYARAFDQAQENAGIPLEERRYSRPDLENFRKSVEGDPSIDQNLYPNQSAWDYILENNAPISKTNFSASGGTEQVQYYAGLNYLYQEGNWSKSNLGRAGLVAKLDLTPTDKTRISLSLNGYNELTKGPSSSGAGPYIAATGLLPTEPIVWADGRLALSSRDVILQDVVNNGDRLEDQTQVLSSLSLEQELFKGLKVKGVFAYDWTTRFNKHWQEPRSTYYTINLATDPYTFDEVVSSDKHSLFQAQRSSKNYTYQGIITYDRAFGGHRLSLLGVAEARNTRANNFSASRSGFELPIDELSLGSADKDLQSNGGGSSETAQVGYVYRMGYDYAGKYLLEVAGRYDGHYYFAPGERYGFFPSFSLGWRLSEEPFLQSFSQLDNLKFRTSWGQSGNLAGGPNQFSSSLVLYGNSFPFGNTPTQGVYASREGNPHITWERATKLNVGVDFSFFNGLLSGEVDYFSEDRNNMLLSPNASVPQEYGISLGQVNAGVMENKGIDLLLSSNKTFSNGLRAGLTLTYTYAHNTLVETFENPVTANDPVRSREGKEYGALFGLEADGLFQLADDRNGDGIITAEDGFPEYKLGGTLRPGSIKYVDTNGDGVIDLTDEKRIGHPATPEVIYSLATNVSWKGLDLNVMFQGADNASMFLEGTYIRAFAENRNYPTFLLNDSWTPDNPDARFPALSPTGLNGNDALPNTTFYLVDAAYLRLKFAELGFTLPANLTDRFRLGDVRLFLSGINLLTWSDTVDYYIDAEAGNAAQRGWYHPQQSTYTFGLNVGF